MIFKKLAKDKLPIEVKMSCFELHIEMVRDLIDSKNSEAQIMTKLSKWKPSEISVSSAEDVALLLQKAVSNRKVASTAMNDVSSRSHCIF